jgi:hypothetical protein
MDDDARERTLDDDTIKYLEALLASIVAGAGAYAVTLFDFLFRARHFDAMLLPDTAHRDPTPAGARYLPPLTFLLLNQIFYFYVCPGPSGTRSTASRPASGIRTCWRSCSSWDP